MAAIVESSDDAITSTTLDAVIVSWNIGAEKIYGYTKPEVVGRSIAMVIPPERCDEVHEIAERLRHGEVVKNLETERLRKDGSRINVSLTISPIKDITGKITGASTIARESLQRSAAGGVFKEDRHRQCL